MLNGDGILFNNHFTGALRNSANDNTFTGTLGPEHERRGLDRDSVGIAHQRRDDHDHGRARLRPRTDRPDLGRRRGAATSACSRSRRYPANDTFTYVDTVGGLANSGGGTAAVTSATVGVDSGTTLTIGAGLGLPGTGTIADNGLNQSLIKELTGTLVLSSANTYGGLTVVNAGALQVENGQALGGTTNGTEVKDGAQLQLQTPAIGPLAGQPVVVSGESLILSGTGINGTGALLDTGGNNTWQGTVALAKIRSCWSRRAIPRPSRPRAWRSARPTSAIPSPWTAWSPRAPR